MSHWSLEAHQQMFAAHVEWERHFTQLADFIHDRGHCDLGTHPLGDWLRHQQQAAQAGTLSPQRHQRLLDLGVTFTVPAETWEAALQRLRDYLIQHGVRRDEARIIWLPQPPDGPLAAWLREQRAMHDAGLLRPDQSRLLRSLRLIAAPPRPRVSPPAPTSRPPSTWDLHLQALQEYHRQFGHCDVPQGWPPNPDLAAWVAYVRGQHDRGRLSPQRFQQLHALGFSWSVVNDHFQQLWDSRFAELIAFKEKHGHTRVAKSHNRQLSHWRHIQRTFRRKGILKPERIARLDAIGFEWEDQGKPFAKSREDRWDQQWEQRFTELLAFKAQHGHTHVVVGWKPNPQLAAWVGDQREKYHHGQLRPDRRERLQSISFLWSPGRHTLHDLWEKRFAELIAFKEKHGHTRVMKSHNRQLSHWRHVQRDFRRKGTLSDERIARLDAIGFEWEDKGKPFAKSREDRWEQQWEQRFNELLAFVAEHGHTHVVVGWKPNPRLATWVGDQRERYHHGQLRPDRQERLESIGFLWSPGRPTLHNLWEKRYAELVAFKAKHGHTRVLRSHDAPLSHWRMVQREFRRKGTLSDERIARLDAIGFEWEG